MINSQSVNAQQFFGEGWGMRHLSSTMKIGPGLEDHCHPQITFSDPITKARILGQPEQLNPHRTRVHPDKSRLFTSIASPCSIITLWTGAFSGLFSFSPWNNPGKITTAQLLCV